MPDKTPVVSWHNHSLTVLQATRWLGVFVLLLAILTVTQGVYLTGRQSAVTECQSRYNNDFAHVLNLRAKLQDSDREALQTLVFGLNDATSQKQSRAAFDKYVAKLEATQQQRLAHPLPTLNAEERCR